MDDIVKVTQAIASAAQALAIVVGGAWVYFKFLRGRTFARRAELDLEATLSVVSEKQLITSRATLKNVGLSRLPLNKGLQNVELFATTAAPAVEGANVGWMSIMQAQVFTEHAWVEAQETIDQQVLFPAPARRAGDEPWRAFKLELKVFGKRTLGPGDPTTWSENTILLAQVDHKSMA